MRNVKHQLVINRTLSGLQDPVTPKAGLNYNPVYFAGISSKYLTTVLGLDLIGIQVIIEFLNYSFRRHLEIQK